MSPNERINSGAPYRQGFVNRILARTMRLGGRRDFAMEAGRTSWQAAFGVEGVALLESECQAIITDVEHFQFECCQNLGTQDLVEATRKNLKTTGAARIAWRKLKRIAGVECRVDE